MKNAYSGDKQNHEASPENTKDTIQKNLFLKVLLCIIYPFQATGTGPFFFIFFHTPQRPAKIETRIEP